MSDNFENKNSNSVKRRRCFYDFSKDYPGTHYDKSKRAGISDELDSKKAITRNVLAALAIILSFALSYFIVYTVIGISHEDVEGLDAIGATSAEETYSVSDEDIINMIRDRSSAQAQQSSDSEDVTVSSSADDTQNNLSYDETAENETAVSDVLDFSQADISE